MLQRVRNSFLFGFVPVAILVGTGIAHAVKPAAQLLPVDTRLYVSIPDVAALRSSFRKTQLGELSNDSVMKPFVEDLTDQIRHRLGSTRAELGIDWKDLEGVYAGEACIARIHSEGEAKRLATILMVDVTNHPKEMEQVRESIAKSMDDRKATKLPDKKIGDITVTAYQLPKKRGAKAREAYFYVVADQFIVTDNLAVAANVVTRANGGEVGTTLEANPSFAKVMSEVAAASSEMQPHVRWYVDPFGYAELVKASNVSNMRRKTDMVEKLKKQGFDAVKAGGGHINLAPEELEILHRTFILSPPGELKNAARMLVFPVGSHNTPPAWVPRELATYLSWNWNLRAAFDYGTSLIDEMVDAEGFVEDVLSSFEKDLRGPQINIRTELLDQLDDQIVLFSDYELPISTKSERVLVGIKVKDEEKVAAALRKLWKTDPTAREREMRGRVVWEIVPEVVEPIELDIPGAIPLNEGDVEPIQIPNYAMTAARGYLLISTSINLLDKVLEERATFDSLNEAADFETVNRKLEELGAGEDSFRFFSRTDEEYRSAYEMIRQGKMPESESILARMLNRLLGPKEKGVLRQQKLDGKSLPDYQIVRRYLGPAGLFVQPRDDGWFVTGIMVSKEKLVDKGAARNVLTTAAKTVAVPPDSDR